MLLLLGTGLWARLVEPYWIETTHTALRWAGPSVRIVVLGDFHAGRTGRWEVERAVALSNAVQPDLILLSGDYISGVEATDRKLERRGITVLRNQWRVAAPGVVVIGLEDWQAGHTDGVRAFAGVPGGGPVW